MADSSSHRGHLKRKLFVFYDEDDEIVPMIYRFKILLPNGTSVELKLRDPNPEMSLRDFIGLVKEKYLVTRKSSQRRDINWSGSSTLFLQDVNDVKIRNIVRFKNYKPHKCHILRLHDESSDVAKTFENMWDLTPDTELLSELPEEYGFETALADLIDNSLQAVWSNGENERRLIRVNVGVDKISIFDSGPGMDDTDENSLVKWGKLGASLHRSSRPQAIGGKPPYLKPCFGMFGFGGPIASMHLGGRVEVSSKTKHIKKVYLLHLERDALLRTNWKTVGGIRDPTEEEIRDSRHGSFTKVEIFGPKFKDKINKLQCHMKDIYFPYIQCDDMYKSGRTITPIEFQVNGVGLTEIEGGEVAITNLHSSNGPEFVLQLHFYHDSPGSRVSQEANARLRLVYFPFREGKENIEKILEKLKADGCEIKENFQNFSRVSIRRLGRLLPAARWAMLPFMNLTHLRSHKGNKANILKRCCLRVKCFVETDAGFKPTPSKTDLAHNNPFTAALRNLGNRNPENDTEVVVEIRKAGKNLTPSQLEKEYREWILQMHEQYDEVDSGEDQAVIITSLPNKEKLGISSDVVRVHQKLKRKEKSWNRGERIKVLKGACAGYSKNIFATIEYFLLEGLEGDTGGEGRIICRPIDIPVDNGCVLLVDDENPSLDTRGCLSLPLSGIDCGKIVPVTRLEWTSQLNKKQQKSPATIDLPNWNRGKQLEVERLESTYENRLIVKPSAKVGTWKDLSRSPSPCRVSHSSNKRSELHSLTPENQQHPRSVFNEFVLEHGHCTVPSTPISPNEEAFCSNATTPSQNSELNPIFEHPVVKNPKVDDDDSQPHPLDEFVVQQDAPSLNQEKNSLRSFVNEDEELQDILSIGEKIKEKEKNLDSLNNLKAETEQEVLKLLEKTEPRELSLMNCLSKEELEKRINSMENPAASVHLSLSTSQNNLKEDIVGLVALLGTVQSPGLSRILAEYLGEDKMLAIICRTFDTAIALERYSQNGEVDSTSALYAEAAALGKVLSRRFLVICLEEIRPYNRRFQGDSQRKLKIPDPTLPNGRMPGGFLGFAVNMIDLDTHHLRTRTASGYGLRETVLFSLFRKLQVYETKDHMLAARACIDDGAVSLDGGIIRENGMISLGYGNPLVCFPSETQFVTQQIREIVSQIEEKKSKLTSIEDTIEILSKRREKCIKKFHKRQSRYERQMDKMENVMKEKSCLLEYKPRERGDSLITE